MQKDFGKKNKKQSAGKYCLLDACFHFDMPFNSILMKDLILLDELLKKDQSPMSVHSSLGLGSRGAVSPEKRTKTNPS